ncbi:TPA_asm: DUF4376 domain-containing protein [Salmonella enterica subsp. enterica serovar Java]|nr:DUF4376 domain-containing protein [Salmonella enterica subsp. enterica serovar Java]
MGKTQDTLTAVASAEDTHSAFFGVRNPAYLEDGRIDCEVQQQDGEIWLPYTVSGTDTDARGQLLWSELLSGAHGDIAPFVVTDEMLASARRQKMDEISAWRDAEENGSIFFTVNGHRWDASKASQSRLAPVVAVASAGGLPPGFFWTDADNQDVPMDTASLKKLELSMQGAMVMRGFQIHERQRKMKEDIAQLTSLDAIRNYPVGWAESS